MEVVGVERKILDARSGEQVEGRGRLARKCLEKEEGCGE